MIVEVFIVTNCCSDNPNCVRAALLEARKGAARERCMELLLLLLLLIHSTPKKAPAKRRLTVKLWIKRL